MASLKGNVEIKFRSLERENTKGIVRCSNPKNEIAREERCSDDQKVTIGLDISSAELNIFCGFRQLSRPSQTNEATNAPLNGFRNGARAPVWGPENTSVQAQSPENRVPVLKKSKGFTYKILQKSKNFKDLHRIQK